MSGEKTEKASAKKRRDERKKGNVFKSQDIITVVSLVGCFYALKVMFPLIYVTVRDYLVDSFNGIATVSTISNEGIMVIQNQIIFALAKAAMPLLLVSVVLAVISTGIQTRFLISMESLTPKLSKISPISGIKKMFSLKNVVELIKNILKISLLLVLLYQFMMDRTTEVTKTLNMDLDNSIHYLLMEIMDLIKLVAMWFAVIAAFDYLYQRWDYERQIKMTKQEVKEEYKMTEGNPEIKGKIKQMQRERAQSRMMQAVPTADVIIKNPTHFAVALKYDQDHYGAPIVIAKGQDELALRIIKIAEENHVEVVENQPLARAIYASTELNQEIPPEFYGTVAEILVYVYKLNHKEIHG